LNKIILAVGFCIAGVLLIAFLLIKSQGGLSGDPGAFASMDGPAIFGRSCARCHGKLGEGIPNLTPPLRGRNIPLAHIKKQIQKGSLKMPALPFIRGKALDRLARHVAGLK